MVLGDRFVIVNGELFAVNRLPFTEGLKPDGPYFKIYGQVPPNQLKVAVL
jgi:hypothetical protein